jgi:uncharacterized membrane protein YtjA (UPF0391 family)
MLHNALVFLVVALIAGVLGFTGIAGVPLGIAKVVCVAFAILSVVSLSMVRRGGG